MDQEKEGKMVAEATSTTRIRKTKNLVSLVVHSRLPHSYFPPFPSVIARILHALLPGAY